MFPRGAYARWPRIARRMHEGGCDEPIEEFLSKRVADKKGPSISVTSTRRESLALYRSILRTCRMFVWTNEQGVMWKDILRTSARNEFESARYETDPEKIAKQLVVGMDALQATLDKFGAKQEQLVNAKWPHHQP